MLKIGMFGAGTVGGGVYELLMQKHPSQNVTISKICVRSLDKKRDFDVDLAKTVVTDNPADLLEDDSLDCFVEVMGGSSPDSLAKQVVLTGLSKNKAVVTANKALVAECLTELQVLQKEHPKSILCLEAAVCGGIPIIHTLQSTYAADTITALRGLMNGTTNYMLTKMEEGADYAAVLQEAQELGYAEADPTADVQGHDVRAKLLILTQLAFGVTLTTDQIPTMGISNVTATDFHHAKKLGSTIKLVGVAQKDAKDSLDVHIGPALVSTKHVLANIRGSGNVVLVESENMGGTSWYAGPGAGRFPTANSVVADILRVAQGATAATPFAVDKECTLDSDYTAAFYVRTKTAVDAIQNSLTVDTVLQEPKETEQLCFTTAPCKFSQVREAVAEDDKALIMPILE